MALFTCLFYSLVFYFLVVAYSLGHLIDYVFSFASHVIAREKYSNKENSVFVYDVKQKGEEVIGVLHDVFLIWITLNTQLY